MIKKESEHPSELKGLAEMNLMEYPFALLHPNDKRKAIVCEVWIKENDKRMQVRWTAAVDIFSQLPTELGVRVFHALLLLAERQEWSQRVQFTIYQILKVLGLPTTKHYYEAVKQELVSLTDVTITSEGAFWDNAKKKRISLHKFHLLDELSMAYTLQSTQVTEHEGVNYVVIGSHVLRSIEANYIKQISYSVWLDLKKPVSRILYIFLLKWMGYRDRCEIDIFQLASRLGLTAYKYPSKVREKLQPAFDELMSIGFLDHVEYVTVGAYSRIRFIKPSKYEVHEQQLQTDIDPSEEKQFKDELNYFLRAAGKQPVSSVKLEVLAEQRE